MRRYSYLAGRPGGFMNWPGRPVTADARIRVVTCVLFRRWFGHAAAFHYVVGSSFAEARDNRGNYLQVTQWNGYDGCEPDLTRLALEDRK